MTIFFGKGMELEVHVRATGLKRWSRDHKTYNKSDEVWKFSLSSIAFRTYPLSKSATLTLHSLESHEIDFLPFFISKNAY